MSARIDVRIAGVQLVSGGLGEFPRPSRHRPEPGRGPSNQFDNPEPAGESQHCKCRKGDDTARALAAERVNIDG